MGEGEKSCRFLDVAHKTIILKEQLGHFHMMWWGQVGVTSQKHMDGKKMN